jgi:hypothetical protein
MNDSDLLDLIVKLVNSSIQNPPIYLNTYEVVRSHYDDKFEMDRFTPGEDYWKTIQYKNKKKTINNVYSFFSNQVLVGCVYVSSDKNIVIFERLEFNSNCGQNERSIAFFLTLFIAEIYIFFSPKHKIAQFSNVPKKNWIYCKDYGSTCSKLPGSCSSPCGKVCTQQPYVHFYLP